MPKRKNNRVRCFKTQPPNLSTLDIQNGRNMNDVTNISSGSKDYFFDKTERIMSKRGKHIESFYDRTKELSGQFKFCPKLTIDF